MSITLAGKSVPQLDGLSPSARLILALIDGGLEWFAWANHSSSFRYDFRDETTLLTEVQSGLHASSLMFLPTLGLLIGPAKLMTLSLPDLRLLAKAEVGEHSDVIAAQLRRIYAEQQIATREDLRAADELLEDLGVAEAGVFRALGFEERLAVQELLYVSAPDGVPPSAAVSDLQREAAQFALEQCRTVLEFADYYRFYIESTANLSTVQSDPEQRGARAREALATLLPLSFGALDCPRVVGLPAPGEVARAVNDWLGQGRQLGFARLSEAVLQIMASSAFKGETGDAAQSIVSRYLQAAQSFIAKNPLRRSMIRQDGVSGQYTFESESLRAELLLQPSGVISLHAFGARAKRQPERAVQPNPAPSGASSTEIQP